MTETRKLAAILVSDVVGYSRLAGADEDRILARLRALRSDLIDLIIAVHNGRVVKRTGDGAIVEFRVHPFDANSSKKSHSLQLMCSGQFPIEPAAPSVHFPPRFRALALFGRRPHQRVNSLVMPATENLHKSGRLRQLCS